MEYLVNEEVERTRVVLSVEEYERLVEAAEDLEDIREHGRVMADIRAGREEVVPWEPIRSRIGSEYRDR